MKKHEAPSPRPCESCPYRCDVPSGVWAASEYRKLPQYDADTAYQPTQVFLCHQQDSDAATRLCGGWVGTHDPDKSLSLRLAHAMGNISTAVLDKVFSYVSPVPLFRTGKQAADHGMRELLNPSEKASSVAHKIARNRSDIVIGED